MKKNKKAYENYMINMNALNDVIPPASYFELPKKNKKKVKISKCQQNLISRK